ncbi:MAG: hypothetical protein IPK13_20880 [Deltaproteobacteria bacterium]|nr:hypothetical protein [Deltaproteobacteria bacterium]
MPWVEIVDRTRIEALFADDPRTFLEVLDENQRGVDGLVTVFAPESPPESPPDSVTDTAKTCFAVRWGQRALGLGSKAVLRAFRVGDVERLIPDLPWRGHLEVRLPFWASGIVGAMFRTDALTAEATYELKPEAVRPPAALSYCVEVSKDEDDILGPIFPKRVPGSPAFLLAPGGGLASLAAVTHQYGGMARVSVYTVEEARGRGFGRAVLVALARALMRQNLVPTVTVDLGRVAEVRMVEASGFSLHDVGLRVLLSGQQE